MKRGLIGGLDTRVKLQAPTRTTNAHGEATITGWTDVAPAFWAEVIALSSREVALARQAQLQTTHKVRIRYQPLLIPKMKTDCRLTYTRDGVTHYLALDGKTPGEERRRWLIFTCVETTNG